MIIFSNRIKRIKRISNKKDLFKIIFHNGNEIQAELMQTEQLKNVGNCQVYRRIDNNENLIVSKSIELVDLAGHQPDSLQSKNSAFTRFENYFISPYNPVEQEKILLANQNSNIVDIRAIKSIVPNVKSKGLYKITFTDNVSIDAKFCLKLLDHSVSERSYFFKQEGGQNIFFSISSPMSLKLERKLVNNISQER